MARVASAVAALAALCCLVVCLACSCVCVCVCPGSKAPRKARKAIVCGPSFAPNVLVPSAHQQASQAIQPHDSTMEPSQMLMPGEASWFDLAIKPAQPLASAHSHPEPAEETSHAANEPAPRPNRDATTRVHAKIPSTHSTHRADPTSRPSRPPTASSSKSHQGSSRKTRSRSSSSSNAPCSTCVARHNKCKT